MVCPFQILFEEGGWRNWQQLVDAKRSVLFKKAPKPSPHYLESARGEDVVSRPVIFISPTTAGPLLAFLEHKNSQVVSVIYPLFFQSQVEGTVNFAKLTESIWEFWIFEDYAYPGLHRVLWLPWDWCFQTDLVPGMSCQDSYVASCTTNQLHLLLGS